LWQEEIEKRRDMARLQISSNDQKGLTQAKPGGATHSSRRTVTYFRPAHISCILTENSSSNC
ncbi:MAG: hypothetical protein WBG50_27265, partial [Desulfomonilaceae bacterium]